MFFSRQHFAHLQLHICASNNSSQFHLENGDLDSAQNVTRCRDGNFSRVNQIIFFFLKLVTKCVRKKLSRGRRCCLWQPAASQSFLIICSLCTYYIDATVPWQVPNLVGVGRPESLPLTKCYSLPMCATPNSLVHSLVITYLILDPDKGNLTDCKADS